jgi:hypothetical protein
MIIATVSGPVSRIARSISWSNCAQCAAGSPASSCRKAFVLETRTTGIGDAPNGSFIGRTPVNDSAPSVTPW